MFNVVLDVVKWFAALAAKDKVVALITVLFMVIAGTSFVSWKIYSRSEAKDASSVAKADRRQYTCDSVVLVKDAQIAQLNVEKLELIKEFYQEMKQLKGVTQDVKEEKVELATELKANNKRITRKLSNLNKEFVKKDGN
jgi:hypothetical protein